MRTSIVDHPDGVEAVEVVRALGAVGTVIAIGTVGTVKFVLMWLRRKALWTKNADSLLTVLVRKVSYEQC